ncbi:alpha-1,6-mannanase, glycoside hydrolase family 76 protein [Pseudohyphozyma bogoriensis]|nr:alpha-1,6-mannanase, glycoside hydrolase family 76 protein [Pseudohyphozyma bogoriensis]
MLLRSTLALLFINKCIASASAPSPPQPTSPAPDEQQTYLHFPHPETRQGTAFLPRDATDASPDLEGIEWSKIPIADPDKVMNPAPAWMRHPLAPRVPLDVSRQPAPKKRRADGGEEEAQEELLPGEGVWRDRKHKRDVITESEAPYPPAAYIDVNNLTTIALVAQAAAARMQTWYEDGLYEWTQWWQTPVIGMAYANLDLAFGNSGNELLVRDLLIKNDGLGWMIDKYIDDQSWWAMFALRAYQAYPNETWLGMVEAIVQNDTLYWDDTCGGGILWLTYRQQYKNTITNGLYFSSLARLYRWTGNYTYFQYSMNTLNWWLEWGFETSTGRVYDTITAPDCNVTGLQSWTYNSGAFLYGLADLYYATGNTSLLDLGRSIAYAAIRDFSYEDVGVLYESCEDDPQPSADLPPGCQSDEVAFKGVLMMGMAELYLARPDSNLYNYINTQLLSNVFNNLDESWLFGEWWQGPWNETTAGPKTQITALAMLSAAALVNADYLSKVSGGNTVMTGIATDQVAFPNNATLTGNSAGSTQRSSLNSDASSLRWNAGPAIVLAALGVTTGGVVTLWL